MDDIPLTERFPGLQPGKKPGGLGSVNGFGTTLLGHRDHDPETDTYVVTHALTALFIPVFALGAYRVASAGGVGCPSPPSRKRNSAPQPTSTWTPCIASSTTAGP